jgi:hypothetical protein
VKGDIFLASAYVATFMKSQSFLVLLNKRVSHATIFLGIHYIQPNASTLQYIIESIGLPISVLGMALLRTSKGDTKRRTKEVTGTLDFPSWSQMGWVGSVEFTELKNLASRTICKVL